MSGNIFPLPFSTHLIFVAVAFLFFIIQFVRIRKKYQLIMAVAVALTMLIYVKETKMWFYGVGILEFGLLVLALVAAIMERDKKTEAQTDENEAEASLEEAEAFDGEE